MAASSDTSSLKSDRVRAPLKESKTTITPESETKFTNQNKIEPPASVEQTPKVSTRFEVGQTERKNVFTTPVQSIRAESNENRS